MDSRLVYVAKKSGTVPRPIRVGEIWRRLTSKHLLHRHEAKIRRTMIDACQLGVSMPGGAEAMVHTREIIEGTIRASPDLGTWTVIDVDFQNAFPLLFYEAIDSSLATNVLELRPWSRWRQDHCSVIFTFPGQKHRARR